MIFSRRRKRGEGTRTHNGLLEASRRLLAIVTSEISLLIAINLHGKGCEVPVPGLKKNSIVS